MEPIDQRFHFFIGANALVEDGEAADGEAVVMISGDEVRHAVIEKLVIGDQGDDMGDTCSL